MSINVTHLAKLSSLSLNQKQASALSSQLEATLDTISTLDELDTSAVEPTSQVTGLTNVFREDVIDSSRVLSPKQALAHAHQSHNGYFVVPQVIDA